MSTIVTLTPPSTTVVAFTPAGVSMRSAGIPTVSGAYDSPLTYDSGARYDSAALIGASATMTGFEES